MSNQTWRRIIHVVILHITEPLVLMLEREEGWSLPMIRSAGEELRQPGPYNVSDQQLIRIRLQHFPVNLNRRGFTAIRR